MKWHFMLDLKFFFIVAIIRNIKILMMKDVESAMKEEKKTNY